MTMKRKRKRKKKRKRRTATTAVATKEIPMQNVEKLCWQMEREKHHLQKQHQLKRINQKNKKLSRKVVKVIAAVTVKAIAVTTMLKVKYRQ